MITNQRYVVLSLELHLFFLRIMKEHSFFLEAAFTPKDSKYADEAEYYKNEFEKLLLETVSISNGIIGSNVLTSGEIITEFTLITEQKTQNFTGIDINQNITKRESQLRAGRDSRVRNELIMHVNWINENAIMLLKGLINFKKIILDEVLVCKMFTLNYPLLIEHIIREAELYLSLIIDLENGIDIDSMDIRETELFWDQIMMEHAMFIRGLLDPSEDNLIDTADEFANDFKSLIEKAQETTNMTMDNVVNETLDQTTQLKNFKHAGTEGITSCKIRSIILPLLADHVLREANHYIRLLEMYKGI